VFYNSNDEENVIGLVSGCALGAISQNGVYINIVVVKVYIYICDYSVRFSSGIL
jgi:hypothetical protein